MVISAQVQKYGTMPLWQWNHSSWRDLLRTTPSLIAALFLSSLVSQIGAVVYPTNHELYKFDYLGPNRQYLGTSRPFTKRDKPIPLIITNNCGDTLWPGIRTQHGDPPDTHGFELAPGDSKHQTVGPTWQGRIWGHCEYGGAAPATLAEFNLAGGSTGTQTFYDISLVDGYNLPIAVVYHPADNTTYIPPNLVNPSCIGTPGYLAAFSKTGLTYTNSTYPMPYEDIQSNTDLSNWCPWDLQAFPPEKPGDGVYPYPDDNLERPVFDPCKSACAFSNEPKDCCTGEYDDPWVCEPSKYSANAKAMCPDAYSYAFDDQTSTFIIPSGGGWEVIFCPAGRSTNILATFNNELRSIAAGGGVTNGVREKAANRTFIESKQKSAAVGLRLYEIGMVMLDVGLVVEFVIL
ncbi:hypothetical protein ABKA04_007296 [Annulohypoxylon sp. FPYF3050]